MLIICTSCKIETSYHSACLQNSLTYLLNFMHFCYPWLLITFFTFFIGETLLFNKGKSLLKCWQWKSKSSNAFVRYGPIFSSDKATMICWKIFQSQNNNVDIFRTSFLFATIFHFLASLIIKIMQFDTLLNAWYSAIP